MGQGEFADIAVDLPLTGLLTYKVPEELRGRIGPGSIVRVPLRRSEINGVVISLHGKPPSTEPREVLGLLEESPLFTEKEMEWYRWASRYYFQPLSRVLFAGIGFLPGPRGKGRRRPPDPFPDEGEGPRKTIPQLTEGQRQALERIEPAICESKFETFLLWGVTASGKTEVYLRAIQVALECGKEAIVLVPEISLTDQLVTELRGRFGRRVALLHSKLSRGERAEMWLRVHRGEIPVVVGARSAVFAPCHNLGLIVVDEEHDGAYKQEEGFRYNARDMALMRGKIMGFPVILGSATPSLETYYNARRGKICLLELPERPEGRGPTEVQVVDLRRRGRKVRARGIISPPLHQAMAETLERGEQVLLFLNRRGFATFLICEDCGYTFRCRNCAVSLVHHLSEGALMCHYCGWKHPAPPLCPSCGGPDVRDLGIGTEAVELAVRELFPWARVLRMDKDTTTRKHAHREILRAWRRGEADILIGTQMIAKGHHVPNVTLVGIILADSTLNLPDFRASERTYQLLIQVAGRAGRGRRPGRVIVQSYEPDHPAIAFCPSQDYEAFASRELRLRKRASYPPYSRLVLMRVSAPREDSAAKAATLLGDVAKKICGEKDEVLCLGPSPAPIAKLKGRFRWQLLLKSPSRPRLREAVESILREASGKMPPRARLAVDVDPQSFL
jgi:primosomal protein N' (replication factor Y)